MKKATICVVALAWLGALAGGALARTRAHAPAHRMAPARRCAAVSAHGKARQAGSHRRRRTKACRARHRPAHGRRVARRRHRPRPGHAAARKPTRTKDRRSGQAGGGAGSGSGSASVSRPDSGSSGSSGPSGSSGSSGTSPGSSPASSPSSPAGSSGASAWDRPALDNPITVQVTPANSNLKLSPTQDYVLRCPAGPLALAGPLTISGGHDVVLEDCDIELTVANWAGELRNQTGTLWIHDVHFGGASLTGGIQMQEPDATVVMRDVYFDQVHGSYQTNHAELIQTWSGPRRLLIDGLTGSTGYQGLFLLPNQFDSGPPPQVFDLRDIDIDDSQGAYALWLGDVAGSSPSDAASAIATWNVDHVYVVPNPTKTWPGWWLWPKPSTPDPTWDGVIAGAPPGGSFVRPVAGGASGVDEGAAPAPLAGEQP